MRNPAAMKKVQEEIRTVVGNKAKIEIEDVEKIDGVYALSDKRDSEITSTSSFINAYRISGRCLD